MDDLKKFCYDNKDSMDVDLPGAAGWLNIEQKLNAPKKGRLVSGSFLYRVAAAFVIIVAAWVYYYINPDVPKVPVATAIHLEPSTSSSSITPDNYQNKSGSVNIDSSQQLLAGKNISPVLTHHTLSNKTKEKIAHKESSRDEKVFNDMQSSYVEMVNYQLDKVRRTPIYAENADYFNLFKTEFADLDKDEKQLRVEIKQAGINDDMIMRMINIYQEKIVLLKELQSEILKMNNRYKSTVPDSPNALPSFIKL
ncbi:MAG: hypothetical protein ABIR81_06925 [Ginsengibacter sp.]